MIPIVAAGDNPEDFTEIPLEELSQLEVYSASKFSQKASEAPSSISIISATDIQRYGYRTFSDILRSIPGFYVTNDRNYEYLGVRGFALAGNYNTNILILIDGHRLNDNLYSSSGVGTDFPIAIDLIDRIEIVRGPGSALYGTNALFATINVITRRGKEFNGSRFSMEAGSRQTYQGIASYGRQFANGIEVLLSGSYMDSKGERRLYYPEFDSPENNNGIAQDGDTDNSRSFLADVSYKDLSARLVYNAREKRIPTAAYGIVFNDRRNKTEDDRAYLELKFDHAYRETWRFLARSSLDAYEARGTYIYDDGAGGLQFNRDKDSGRWWNNEIQVTRTFKQRHHVTAGTELRFNYLASQKNYDDPDYFVYFNNRNPSSVESGMYFQGETALRNNLLLSGGIRFDHYSSFGWTANPRIALVYSPWEKTTAKLLYGQAFRAPNLYELYYEASSTNKSNPRLQPEKMHTLEFILEQYLARKLRFSGSGYFYKVHNQITQQIDPIDSFLVFQNFGGTIAAGMELQLEGKDIHGIDAGLSYSYQKTEDETTGISRMNSPHHMLQMNVFVPAFKMRGGAGLEMQYMSSRKTLRNNEVDGFFRTNLAFTYKNLLPGIDLAAGLYNIFNRRYSDPANGEHVQDSLVQDGRSFRIKLSYAIKMHRK